jgi:hypothetical protein
MLQRLRGKIGLVAELNLFKKGNWPTKAYRITEQ